MNRKLRDFLGLTMYCLLFTISPFVVKGSNGASQVLNRMITARFSGENLEQALQKLEKESGCKFAYDVNLIEAIEQEYMLEFNNKPFTEVLDVVLKPTGLKYSNDGDLVILYRDANPQNQQPKQQTGTIYGVVHDEAGEGLIGATVWIKELKTGTMTDNNGDYQISIRPGTYTVFVRFVSYKTQVSKNIKVEAGKSAMLNAKLKPTFHDIEEVVVSQKVQRSTDVGFNTMKRNSAVVIDGMSSAQIARIPDSDVASSLKRITGITTKEDKYVVVRSLSERWNQATVDGVNMPSTDAYEQHFQFDIIPNALVEAIVVTKTPTPDMNANFAGAAVEIVTKDIPTSNFTNFGISGSYNTTTTFQTVITKQHGKWDYFGYDDGTRDYPNGVTLVNLAQTEEAQAENDAQSNLFVNDNFTDYTAKAPLNATYQFTIGRSYNLGNNKKWGFVGAATLSNKQETEKIVHIERGAWIERTAHGYGGGDVYDAIRYYGYTNRGASYNYKSTVSGIFNAGFDWSNHHITIRNTYSHFYKNKLTKIRGTHSREGSYDDMLSANQDAGSIETVVYPTYLTMLQNKLEGKHTFKNGIEATWFASRSYIKKDTKDCTVSEVGTGYYGDDLRQAYLLKNTDDKPVYRMFNWNSEVDYNWGATVKSNFRLGNVKNEVKLGCYGVYKTAENQQSKVYLMVSRGNPDGTAITEYMSWAELFSGDYYNWENYSWLKADFQGDKYEGKVTTYAPFAMADHQLTSQLRLVWGIRGEYYNYDEISNQKENDSGVGGDDIAIRDEKTWLFMPSVNVTYNLTKNINLRLGYNRATIRPQFSERMSTAYYNPILSAWMKTSSAGVTNSVIVNYDFKAEWYPTPGEIISGGVYYKNIDDPIEAIGYYDNNRNRYILTCNSKRAQLVGLELEVCKNLTFLGVGEPLEHIYLTGNVSFNWTKVEAYESSNGVGDSPTYITARPLSGQSPYTYNLGTNYQGDRLNFAIAYNVVGDQYQSVGYKYAAEEIAMPRSTVDAQISWKFLKDKKFEVKVYAQNLFRTPYKTYNNEESYVRIKNEDDDFSRVDYVLVDGATDKYDEEIDEVTYHSEKGATFGVSMKYKF